MNMKLAKSGRSVPGICVMAFALCMLLSLGPPEPEICALCGNGEGRRYHAPCVLERSTGLLAELAVYEPEPTRAGELAPVQDLDYHVFQAACGGRVARAVDRTPDLQRCTAYVPDSDAEPDERPFCHACRKLLAGAGKGEYVLVDLYDLRRITVYPLKVGGACRIREYTVTVCRSGEHYQVEVTAELF